MVQGHAIGALSRFIVRRRFWMSGPAADFLADDHYPPSAHDAHEVHYSAKRTKAVSPITAATGMSTICVPAAATLKGPVRVWIMPLHS